jgi:hypothetical protein
VQSLVGELAIEVASSCNVIKRVRKFTAETLAQTFLFAFLQNPKASDEELAQMAGALGVHVTTQAVEQRYSPELVEFLRLLFERSVKFGVKSQVSLAPILERFTDTLLLDSTVISLPPELAEQFPGCGGSHGGGQAAVKIQMQLSLKTGAFDAVNIEAGRDNDMKTPLQQQRLPAGALRITDLGYFNTAVFQRYQDEDTFWLSRLLYGTNVYDVDGNQIDLLKWLDSHGTLVDQRVRIGAEHRVACRIIARRVPPEVAARRRQKLIAAHRKKGRTPSAARLAWCDWMILVTNIPEELLTSDEAYVLYRSRWQVELLFKRWKSQGLVDHLAGSTTDRQMARMWARLLAVVVQHWLVIASVWGDPRSSLKKAYDAVRKFAVLLAVTVQSESRLRETIETIVAAMKSTARQNKRKRPSTFELLNHPEKLDYALT